MSELSVTEPAQESDEAGCEDSEAGEGAGGGK
jgi:hypothetical protein